MAREQREPCKSALSGRRLIEHMVEHGSSYRGIRDIDVDAKFTEGVHNPPKITTECALSTANSTRIHFTISEYCLSSSVETLHFSAFFQVSQ